MQYIRLALNPAPSFLDIPQSIAVSALFGHMAHVVSAPPYISTLAPSLPPIVFVQNMSHVCSQDLFLHHLLQFLSADLSTITCLAALHHVHACVSLTHSSMSGVLHHLLQGLCYKSNSESCKILATGYASFTSLAVTHIQYVLSCAMQLAYDCRITSIVTQLNVRVRILSQTSCCEPVAVLNALETSSSSSIRSTAALHGIADCQLVGDTSPLQQLNAHYFNGQCQSRSICRQLWLRRR